MNNVKNHTLTSREISALTGRRHEDVLADIRTMEPAWSITGGNPFRKESNVYLLTKVESLFIAARFTHSEKEMLVAYWDIFE